MRRGLAAGLALLAFVAAAPAQADEVITAPRAPNEVASCLRDAGVGELAVFGPSTDASATVSPIDLLGGDDLTRVAQARLAPLVTCPQVAHGGGTTVLAGYALAENSTDAVVTATVRDGAGRPFGAPVTLGRMSYPGSLDVAAAVGPTGDAVVAWTEGPDYTRRTGVIRVMAARRAPGGSWGRPEAVGSAVDYGTVDLPPTPVAVGIDAGGRATVAAALPVRGRLDEVSRVEVATARPGVPFGATREVLATPVNVLSELGMSVAPNGRTLVAGLSEGSALLTWERPPAAAVFGAPARPAPGFAWVEKPAVAVRNDGAALLGYRYFARGREGVAVSRRPAGRAFGRPDRVWSRRAPSLRAARRAGPARRLARGSAGGGSTSTGFLISVDSHELAAPPDEGRPRVALGSDGRLSFSATVPRGRPGGDVVHAPLIVTGALTGPLAVSVRGSPCRPANGNEAFIGRDGAPRAGWTDNATTSYGDGFEEPFGAGRVHVVRPGGPASTTPAAPPAVRILGPRRARLFGADPLKIKVSCSGPCDLRASLPRGGEPRAAGGASLGRSGRRTVRLTPAGLKPIAPTRPRVNTVRVEACSPDGSRLRATQRRIVLVRRPPPPIPKPVRIRARRSGDGVVVTWRTRRPAKRLIWLVLGAPFRDAEDLDFNAPTGFAEGRGRRSFRVRLEPKDGYRVRGVTVIANAYDPDSRSPLRYAQVKVR